MILSPVSEPLKPKAQCSWWRKQHVLVSIFQIFASDAFCINLMNSKQRNRFLASVFQTDAKKTPPQHSRCVTPGLLSCAAQVGVTWWCGTVAQWACPGSGAGLCLRPGVMQLFIQPLLHSRSFTGCWTCQQRRSSCRNRNQRLLISQRSPRASTEPAFCRDRHGDVSHTRLSPWAKTEASSDTTVSVSQVEHVFKEMLSGFCQTWSRGRFFPWDSEKQINPSWTVS